MFDTIIGCFLNILHENRAKRAKLCFKLQPAGNNEDDMTSELKTKYSASGYQIEVYNIGDTAFVLEQISLRYREKVITDCIIAEENKTLLPYKCYIYQLNTQEYDAMSWHCKNADLKRCKVFAYDVNGKKSNGSLDLFLPYIQTHPRRE